MKNRFVKDNGLTMRMGWTIFLNGLIYVILILAIWWMFGGSISGVIIAVLVSVGAFFFQWYFSDKIAMKAMGAREVSPEEASDLHTMIDRLCQLADSTKPRVAVSNSAIPNAFATGRSPERSVVCVTRGLLEKLDRDEVEVVLAHELSHVAHRDVTVMTVAGVTGVVAALMMRAGYYMSFGRSNNNNGVPIQLLFILVGAVVYGLSFLLIRSLSRYRELAADRAAAILTGAPSTLASALTKLSGDMSKIPEKDLRASSSANHLALIPAASGKAAFTQLFSTHPSLDKRLEQLARISGQLSQPQ
ncbi:zinc metalloprotease HtpX [Brevibacterium sandarakinum]|uniref:zinc metalloprotease HtpX n=1 Tax=Brevibacterium sandarakinum TaxID=629680 RepID=UPI002654B8F3|nr:zinc metalloprotease HtpX [Brevibacterium sandarakinum]MDN5634299.1 zinc metalloprotease HtpX [Brevibacterium sp.]MDN5657265.1 zinc metalloprotease HtpX [Brevibacterium sandarakinum]